MDTPLMIRLYFVTLPLWQRNTSLAVNHPLPRQTFLLRTGMQDTHNLTRPAGIPGHSSNLAVGTNLPLGNGPDDLDHFFSKNSPAHFGYL